MTKEEAINNLESLYNEIYNEDSDGYIYAEAIDMAIKALQTECAQGVGRYENAMQKLQEMPKYFNGIKAKQIKKISVDVAQGEWIDKGEYAECSICGAHSGMQFDGVEPIPLKSNFCSNCGAKMIGNEKKKENNNTHKAPLYAYTSWDRSEE